MATLALQATAHINLKSACSNATTVYDFFRVRIFELEYCFGHGTHHLHETVTAGKTLIYKCNSFYFLHLYLVFISYNVSVFVLCASALCWYI